LPVQIYSTANDLATAKRGNDGSKLKPDLQSIEQKENIEQVKPAQLLEDRV
jgi:hypothetical protein